MRVKKNRKKLTKSEEDKLIKWCKDTKYNQGDDYQAGIMRNGKYWVSYSNDYPMQHGSGKTYILTEDQANEILNPRTWKEKLIDWIKSLLK